MGTEAIILIMFFGITLGSILYRYRYFENKERMFRIEKGLYTEPGRQEKLFFLLATSLSLIGAGLGLFLGFLLVNYMFTNLRHPQIIYFSLTSLSTGAGLLIALIYEKKNRVGK